MLDAEACWIDEEDDDITETKARNQLSINNGGADATKTENREINEI